MSLNDEERKIIVGLEYEKSLRILSQVEELTKLGYWDNIANRLYYSVFHAVAALLIHDGHSVNTHKGAVVMFGRHYIKSGLLPLEDGRLYSRLQTMREKSDYNCTYDVGKEDVEPMINPAKMFIERIGKLIQD